MIKEINNHINGIKEVGYNYLVKGTIYGKDRKHYMCSTTEEASECFDKLIANDYAVATFDANGKIVPNLCKLPEVNENHIRWLKTVMATLQISSYNEDENEDSAEINDILTALGFKKTIIAFKDLSTHERENFNDFGYDNLTNDTLIEVIYAKDGNELHFNPEGYCYF